MALWRVLVSKRIGLDSEQKARCASLRPTGYTPCELHRLHGGTMCFASPRDALAEQSARGSLVYTQTRLRLIM